MKVRRPVQRKTEKPRLKPKRRDLNPNQFAILRKISNLHPSAVRSLTFQAIRAGGGEIETCYQRGDVHFWHPKEVARFLGWSDRTVEKYTDLYLRIVQREGESAQEFRERRRRANSEEALLVKDFPGTFRILSDRIFLFLILAPTQVRGKNDSVRFLREELGLPCGKTEKIGPSSPVVKWVVREVTAQGVAP